MEKAALPVWGLSSLCVLILILYYSGCISTSAPVSSPGVTSFITVTDNYGREVTIPSRVESVVCSSGGPCVRYLVYMDASDMIAGVDSGDNPDTATRDTRSYTLANPRFTTLPIIGSSSGGANLESIMIIQPDLIFMMGSASNQTSETVSPADTMQEKTGIPVIALPSGSLTTEEGRKELYSSFRLIGKVLHREARAEELVRYIEETIADLERRTADIPEQNQKSAYIGGLSYGGSHGLLSTHSQYPPFLWVHVRNIAKGSFIQTTEYSRESLIYADPDFIFLDAGTLGVVDEVSGLEEIKKPVYAEMKAVKNGNIFITMPFNYRSSNLDTVLADAYFIGKVVYPERFADIDPKTKADEIYTEFVGELVFEKINAACNNLCFSRFPLTGV